VLAPKDRLDQPALLVEQDRLVRPGLQDQPDKHRPYLVLQDRQVPLVRPVLPDRLVRHRP
jgi:hypothetical protein